MFPLSGNPWEAFPFLISHRTKNQTLNEYVSTLRNADPKTFARYVLGLPEQFTAEDVKRAFRNLSRKWHPDKHQKNKPLAKEIMQILEDARDKLLRQLGQ
ncbi:J domain-containing protein [Candidatus Dependentiae bacterium]|nr:MAG: J domain-containing protein [Candidatus Dependentiae bacterium]